MTGTHPLAPGQAVFSTTDADEIDAYLTQSYGSGIRLTRCRSNYQMHHQRAAADSIALDTVSSSGFAATVPPTGQLSVLLVDNGHITRHTEDLHERFGAGDAFVLARPRDPYAIDWRGHPARVRTLTMDVNLLAAVAAVPAQQVAGATFTAMGTAEAQVGRQWRRTVDFVVGTVLDAPRDQPPPPLMVDAVTHTLAAATLTAFPNNLRPAADPTERRDAQPITLRRAISYMETHPDRPMTVTDIADAVHVTPRALQFAFRRHLGTTPLAHLRRIRIDRAHADLLAADPERQTITAIAARWGFADPSRFAAHYRAAYGKPPSQTLQS